MKTQIQTKNLNLIVWIYVLAFVLVTWSFNVRAEEVASAKTESKKITQPLVLIDTTLGKIKVELDQVNAPISTENFLKYVEKKFYDKTIFHRVIPTFMIQGGGHLENMKEKNALYPSIKNEAKNGLENNRGTLAMARMNDKDSATAQFFINVVDNPFLNHKSEDRYGYAVFGKVIEGMDVVDKIKEVSTTTKGEYENVPVKPVVINSIRLVKATEVKNTSTTKTKSKKSK